MSAGRFTRFWRPLKDRMRPRLAPGWPEPYTKSRRGTCAYLPEPCLGAGFPTFLSGIAIFWLIRYSSQVWRCRGKVRKPAVWRKLEERAHMNLMNFPLLVLAFTFVLLFLAAYVGDLLRNKVLPLREDGREDFSVVLGATLTLLALLIGFSFSMAVSRYDQRKNYEEAEANAIGTEYVRADLLPAADAARVHDLLKKYVDEP